MAISRTQPMRPAEINLLEHMDSAESNITQLQEDLEETNRVVGELNDELGQEIVNRQQADTALGTRIDNEAQARTQADNDIQTSLDDIENDIGDLQTEISAIPSIDYGVSSGNVISAGANDVINVTFADEKESTPYVFISLERIEASETGISNCYGIITAVSTTGFSVRVFNANSVNDATVNINWMAIGE